MYWHVPQARADPRPFDLDDLDRVRAELRQDAMQEKTCLLIPRFFPSLTAGSQPRFSRRKVIWFDVGVMKAAETPGGCYGT